MLAAVGALPWIAVLSAHGAAAGWPIRALGVLGFAVGVFVMLVGVGLFRARNATARGRGRGPTGQRAGGRGGRRRRAGLGPHDPCAPDTACASCDATCALSALR